MPLEATGTPFQLLVWQELRAIPYGTTISYGELARRVVGADGSLTGFGGGMTAKRILLDLEAASLF